jgi:hypothetical protein
MRKLPDVGFVHESEQKKSAPKEINVLNFSSGIYFKVKFILRNINADIAISSWHSGIVVHTYWVILVNLPT